ncbi:MAG: hypothetical protein ABR499_22700 [Gemmatimonadaceae bacterium]
MRALTRLSRPHLLAVVALAIGVSLCAGTLVRAVRIEAAPAAAVGADSLRVPDVPERGAAAGGAAAIGDGAVIGDAAIVAAVDVDPFHPARTRPGARYVPGGVGPATPAAAAPPRAPIPMVRLTGLVSRPNGQGLAALSVNGRPARLVRVGQTVEGFRLARIGAGTATLTRPDTTLIVKLPGAPGQQ